MVKALFSPHRLFATWKRSQALARRPRLGKTAKSVRPYVEEFEPRLVLSVPTPDHVVLVIEENHGFSQIIDSPHAPYLNMLASQGALMTNSYAIEHPSQPNYLALFSGSNHGIASNACPQTITAPNLAGELEGQGLTFGGYSEDLPSVGYTECEFLTYARTHNPWVNFTDVPATDNMPFADYFPSDCSTLPTVSIVVPNKDHDMHNGRDPDRIQAGDAWLQENFDAYVQWAYANNSLFVLTFDEDNDREGNHIVTLFVGPMVNSGRYDESINHYTLLRTIEDMYGLPYAGHSAEVDPITDNWVTDAGPATHFFVTLSLPSVTAGTPFPVTVTALDARDNPVPGYTGTVHFTSTDEGAALLGDYTFTADDGGTHVFKEGVTLVTAGDQLLTVTDTVTAITGSATIAVSPAGADHFSIDAPPEVTAGTAFDLIVTARDPFNNIDTNYSGTVTFSSSDPDLGILLPADYTFTTDDGGVHVFPGGVTLLTPGEQTVTASDLAAGIADSVTVTVDPPGKGPRGPQRPRNAGGRRRSIDWLFAAMNLGDHRRRIVSELTSDDLALGSDVGVDLLGREGLPEERAVATLTGKSWRYP